MRISLLLILGTLVLSACTQSNQISSPSPAPTTENSPTPASSLMIETSIEPNPTPSPSVAVSKKPAEIKKYLSSPPTSSTTTTKQPTVQGNSTTNINITSNNTKVEVYTKEGKRYAKLNSKDVELDANGCYKYDDGSTHIESCVNSN